MTKWVERQDRVFGDHAHELVIGPLVAAVYPAASGGFDWEITPSPRVVVAQRLGFGWASDLGGAKKMAIEAALQLALDVEAAVDDARLGACQYCRAEVPAHCDTCARCADERAP